MAMTVPEMIDFEKEMRQIYTDLIDEAKISGNSTQVYRSASGIIDGHFRLGLLFWRLKQDPRDHFTKSVLLAQETSELLENMDPDYRNKALFDPHVTVYPAYLIGLPHPAVDLTDISEHVLADGFFGNVLIGAADIGDWPKYRDALPQEKKYDLTRRTNELYADLLAGRITPEAGVPLAEELWAERENHTYYATGTSGFGDGNEIYVDYVLGAILKKIGSKVPTVHAWVW